MIGRMLEQDDEGMHSVKHSEEVEELSAAEDETTLCVMSFNAADASGSTGLAADQVAILSSGAHALPVTTSIYLRDTCTMFELIEMDSEIVERQARTILEDMDVQIFKIGFAGSPEVLAEVAAICADYDETPVVTHACALSWWERDKIEQYLDALAELILPQTSVLVGNYDLLWRWLLPEWSSSKRPGPRDIATAAAAHGVPFVVLTSVNMTAGTLDTVAASPESVLVSVTLERLEANFLGAGDSFSATLATLLASGDELVAAVREASLYVHRCLLASFSPGMGAAVLDGMFWAHSLQEQSDEADQSGEQTGEHRAFEPEHDGLQTWPVPKTQH
jgi:hydroxymethylpyrimidine/phosphomethylpyrimidine kinase